MTTKAARSSPDADREYEQGNARRFEATLSRILSVPKDELARREAAYKKARRAKKTRRQAR